MKPSTELFELIKSLSKSEKRYFKLYCGTHKGNKNYLKLFDELDKMNKYSEEGLKEKYSRLTFTKKYLYKSIIKSLKAYNEGSLDVNLNEHIANLKILYHKSLIKQFYRSLNALKQQAQELENFNVYHELLKLEIQSIKTGDYNDADQVTILKQIDSTLKVIRNLNEYTLIAAMLREFARKNGMLRDEETFLKVSAIMKTPLLQEGCLPATNKEKDLYYKVISSFVYLKGDMEKLIQCNLSRMEIVKLNPRIFEEDYILKQIEIHGALLYGLIKLEKFEEFNFYFNSLKSLKARTNLERATQFSKTIMYELLYYLKREDFSKGLELVKTAEEGFKVFGGGIQKDDILIVRYYICRVFFGAGRYAEALHYSNEILNHPHIEYRTDVHVYCRILNLIIHFELGNYSLLPYIIKSVYRFLYKQGKVYRFETIMLKFLKTLKLARAGAELNKRLMLLKKELMKLYDDPYEKNVFIYFELMSWLERKIKPIGGNKV